MDLAEQIRKFLPCPEIESSISLIAYKLTQIRNYEKNYAWTLAGLLVENYLVEMFRDTRATNEEIFRYATKHDLADEVLEWANEKM